MSATFTGNACALKGDLVTVGSKVVLSSRLVGKDLNQMDADLYKGQKLVLNIFPSIDTPVCSASTRFFNEKAASIDSENTKVLCISADLPFAQSRFCGAEGIEAVETWSSFRSRFAESLGLEIADGPLKALCARAVIVTDSSHKVVFVSRPEEITEQVDLEGA